METNKPRRISPIITAFLSMGMVTLFIIVFFNANSAYASGLVRVSSNKFLDIKFTSASTNDPGTGIDPGQAVHVGQCTAMLDEKRVDFTVYNGYPSYQCTLSVRLKNMSEQTVRLQRVAPDIPDELVVAQPDLPDGLVLQPEEEVTLEFVLRIQQNAAENAKYRFSIQLIFEDLID